MAALVDIWEAPVGICCPIGPGVLGLREALIGKIAECREDGEQVPADGTRHFWLVVNQLTPQDKLGYKRAFLFIYDLSFITLKINPKVIKLAKFNLKLILYWLIFSLNLIKIHF